MKTRSGRDKRRAWRARLHAQDPRCRFCGKRTRLMSVQPHEKEPHDRAVLIHLYSRLMPKDRLSGEPGERRSELVCKQCADDYGNGIQAMTPIEELRARANRHGESAA